MKIGRSEVDLHFWKYVKIFSDISLKMLSHVKVAKSQRVFTISSHLQNINKIIVRQFFYLLIKIDGTVILSIVNETKIRIRSEI